MYYFAPSPLLQGISMPEVIPIRDEAATQYGIVDIERTGEVQLLAQQALGDRFAKCGYPSISSPTPEAHLPY